MLQIEAGTIMGNSENNQMMSYISDKLLCYGHNDQ